MRGFVAAPHASVNLFVGHRDACVRSTVHKDCRRCCRDVKGYAERYEAGCAGGRCDGRKRRCHSITLTALQVHGVGARYISFGR